MEGVVGDVDVEVGGDEVWFIEFVYDVFVLCECDCVLYDLWVVCEVEGVFVDVVGGDCLVFDVEWYIVFLCGGDDVLMF